MIDWGVESSSSKCYDTQREKKLSHFDIKSWVTGWTKIRPGKVGNWRIFESNRLNNKSQIDSTLRVLLTQHWESYWLNIESLIDSTLRVKLTQHWESNWVNIETQHWESNWLNIESQIDSTLRVKLTQHWEPNWLNIESQIDSTLRVKLTQIFSSYSLCRSNYNSASDSTFKVKMTQFFSLGALRERIKSYLPKKLGQILVSLVTQLFRSKLLIFSIGALRENLSHIYQKSWVKF